jgi:VWFA-related protein
MTKEIRNEKLGRFLTNVCCGTIAAALSGVGASAQEKPKEPEPAPAAQAGGDVVASSVVIKKESRLVLVDAVVTDKKGKYVRDLAQNDFRVYEDNKEQGLTSFSTGTAETPGPNSNQKHYLVLFFDNSSMEMPDQIPARAAAAKFIDANANPNNLMAVVEFGGALRIVQNFTANADLLKRAASNLKGSAVASNMDTGSATVAGDMRAMSSISAAEADYGARTMLLAVRSLAKNLRAIPGRKQLVLISAGFPLSAERQSELTATIDACTKSNVAIYALDAR